MTLGYLVRSVSVEKWPAASAITFTPDGPHSPASSSDSASTAAREAEE